MSGLVGPTDARGIAEAAAFVALFVAVLFAGSKLLPGPRRAGPRLAGGRRPVYTLNGLALFVLATGGLLFAEWAGWIRLAGVSERIVPLLVVANVLAFAGSAVLYARGRARASARGVRGYFYGAEMNPSWLGVDLKLFSYRPSLIGLAVINLSLAARQLEVHGALSEPMVLYQVFAFVYVLNYFHFEHGMVFTWDMVSERFGWMLVWGDYVLVPFFYSLPAWFLVDRVEPLSPAATACLVALFVLGFWLFRGANEQKHRFKTDAGARIWGRPARALEGRLLVSGFWGIGRHLNYSGEICIYLAFTLTTGFDSPLPYLLPLWLTVLLAHRAWRDDRRCREKYGELWDRYVERVRFRMVPFVY